MASNPHPEPRSSTRPSDQPAAPPLDGHRRRATRVDVRIAKQAMQVVLPTNQQIGPWQARAAHLLALAEKQRLAGDVDQAIGEEAAALHEMVLRHQRDLDARMHELPSDVAGSTRFEDTGRALRSVAAVLKKTLDIAWPDHATDGSVNGPKGGAPS